MLERSEREVQEGRGYSWDGGRFLGLEFFDEEGENLWIRNMSAMRSGIWSIIERWVFYGFWCLQENSELFHLTLNSQKCHFLCMRTCRIIQFSYEYTKIFHQKYLCLYHGSFWYSLLWARV
ncbi:unnamed protein product [Moneuplotes crassus]|uniref:Uncharacterized protein n=1 Tax=Euplotes crassus TaxID=5936 RepID=A0AAD2D483_EUPCR|nr:unnamed protein product [Moneuplotes crassus]